MRSGSCSYDCSDNRSYDHLRRLSGSSITNNSPAVCTCAQVAAYTTAASVTSAAIHAAPSPSIALSTHVCSGSCSYTRSFSLLRRLSSHSGGFISIAVWIMPRLISFSINHSLAVLMRSGRRAAVHASSPSSPVDSLAVLSATPHLLLSSPPIEAILE